MVDVRNPAFRAMFREYDLRGPRCRRGAHGGLGTAHRQRLRAPAAGTRHRPRRGRLRQPSRPRPASRTPPSPACWPPAWRWWTSALTISPALYFSQYHLESPAGLMITASHNPSEWCGMKLAQGYSRTLGPAEMRELYGLVEAGESGAGNGRRRTADTRDAYLERVTAGTRLARPLRVAVDCGNGAAGVFAYEALQRIGCLTFQLYCDPDDSYPHYFPNPSDLKARRRLRQIVTPPLHPRRRGAGVRRRRRPHRGAGRAWRRRVERPGADPAGAPGAAAQGGGPPSSTTSSARAAWRRRSRPAAGAR